MPTLELLLRRIVRLLRSGSIHCPAYRSYEQLLQVAECHSVGMLNIAVDFELAWSRARRGNRILSTAESLKRSHRARSLLPVLLDLADVYAIPITFAIVGHAALRDCSEHAIPPKFRPYWMEEDWYTCDPHSSLTENQDYYGKDLLDLICARRDLHEVASHGFSHVDLADDATTPEVAEYEIVESRRVLGFAVPNISTFVFPKNHPAQLSLLRRAGYTIYRNNTQDAVRKTPEGPWSFPLGLWLSPAAFNAQELGTLLDYCAIHRRLMNTWCHLYEFRNENELRKFFEPFFKKVADHRDAGSLAVQTMRDIIKTLHPHGR